MLSLIDIIKGNINYLNLYITPVENGHTGTS